MKKRGFYDFRYRNIIVSIRNDHIYIRTMVSSDVIASISECKFQPLGCLVFTAASTQEHDHCQQT